MYNFKHGDWVMKKYAEIPFVIMEISPDNKIFGMTIRHDSVGPYDFEDIIPIPLSVSIFQQNEFLTNGINYDTMMIDELYYQYGEPCQGSHAPDTLHYIKVKQNNTDSWCVEVYTPEETIYGLVIEYVHELQHIIELCDIYKIIKVFTI